MELKIIGSSSRGNSYVFETMNTALMLEAGIKFTEVKKALNFDISKLMGCFITHEHGDHSKYTKDVLASGIDCFASAGTIEAMGISSHRLHPVKHLEPVKLGSFTIVPFNAKHDAREPFGYLIKHYEMGNTLFLTDSYYVEFTFPNLNNILVECNYSEEILKANLRSGKVNPFVANRVRQSHLELDTLKTMLSANDLSSVINIVLLHLSDGNSDALRFANEIHELTGKCVQVADRDMVIEFNKEPF